MSNVVVFELIDNEGNVIPTHINLQSKPLLPTTKRSTEDKVVEVWDTYKSQWVACHMSSVRPGQIWQVLDSKGNPIPDMCFICYKAPWLERPGQANSNVCMGGNHVLQANKMQEIIKTVTHESQLYLKQSPKLLTLDLHQEAE